MDGRHSNCRIILQKTITLSEEQKHQLKSHAETYIPNESCALLLGTVENNSTKIIDLFLTGNIEESPINFTISSEELLKGYKIAEERNLEVVGIFHSHPNSEPYPSATDQKFMSINPVVWIIFSKTTNEFKAYILESEIKEIPIIS